MVSLYAVDDYENRLGAELELVLAVALPVVVWMESASCLRFANHWIIDCLPTSKFFEFRHDEAMVTDNRVELFIGLIGQNLEHKNVLKFPNLSSGPCRFVLTGEVGRGKLPHSCC